MEKKHLHQVAYSILDLAFVSQGFTPADTFRNSLALARQAEDQGFKRYWFAEHHNMTGIASSATAVLISYVAGGTSKIRVGAGGIMLPNHTPVIIAEQFGTLSSLYPGRIDLGVGRAPGSDQVTAMEVRGGNFHLQHNFSGDISKLQQFFSKEADLLNVKAIPGQGLNVPLWILGSSTESARLAAARGLPYAFASHFAPAQLFEAIRIYRDNFVPSPHLRKPYVIVTANVVGAESDNEARKIFTSAQQYVKGLLTRKMTLLPPPVETMEGRWTSYEADAVNEMLFYTFIGAEELLKRQLSDFLERTEADEIMATAHIFDHASKLRSYGLFSKVMRSVNN